MVSPVILKSKNSSRLLLTVDADVGLHSPNRQADVELVQFGYVFRLKDPTTRKSADEIAAAKLIRPGSPCTGRADDPLVRAIVAHQKGRGGTQDGHVSPFSETHTQYSAADGPHLQMGIALSNCIRDNFDLYPRLDLSTDPACPPSLKSVMLDIFKTL